MFPRRKPYYDVANLAQGVRGSVSEKIREQQENFHELHKQKYHKNLIYYYVPIAKLKPYLEFKKDPPFSKLRIVGRMKDYEIVEDLNRKNRVRLCLNHIEFEDQPEVHQFYEIFGLIEHENQFSVYFFTEIENENEAKAIENDLENKQKNYYDNL